MGPLWKLFKGSLPFLIIMQQNASLLDSLWGWVDDLLPFLLPRLRGAGLSALVVLATRHQHHH